MKSTPDQLKSRGFVPDEPNDFFANKSFDELVKLLNSPHPSERTLSARFLAKKDKRAIEYLCTALHQEKKLYTKIEISNAIVSFGESAVPRLIALLGKIGTNQYKTIAQELFKKNSYPLPRDIAARTLIRIGKSALPFIMETLSTGTESQMSEALDAIGYICFYDKQESYLVELINYYNSSTNELIQWKTIRAMSGFSESLHFLEKEKLVTKNEDIKNEIKRVILLIKKSDKI